MSKKIKIDDIKGKYIIISLNIKDSTFFDILGSRFGKCDFKYESFLEYVKKIEIVKTNINGETTAELTTGTASIYCKISLDLTEDCISIERIDDDNDDDDEEFMRALEFTEMIMATK